MSAQHPGIRLGIVDSDSGFLKVLTKRLESAGYEYRILPGAIPAEELAAMKLNAIVIDPDVLRTDSWEFLEKVCGLLPTLGVVVCSSGSTVAQRVRGLRLGADDWIAKPCHPEEVVARVEAVSRRHRRGRIVPDAGPLVAGELEIRPDQFQAFVSGNDVGLTRREYELLEALAEARGRVIERHALYQGVWGYEMAPGDRSVDVFVRKLRSKLERRSPGWTYIHTHFGIGYRFDPISLEGDRPASSRDAGETDTDAASQPFHNIATGA